MKIIKYNPVYCKQITDLYYETIHNINKLDYTKEELNVWAPYPINYQKWKERLQNKKPFIAIKDKKLLGFAELESSGFIDCFYVHKDHQGQGIGKLLMKNIEINAKKEKIKKLFTKASITAKPFFLAMNFKSIKPNLEILEKYMLKNYIMEKILK